jgi:hypothetical protein
VRGVAFYAVPHSGSNIAENVNKLVRYCNQNLTSSWWQALVEMMRWNVRYHPFTSSWWQALVELLRWNVRYHPLIDNIRPWKRDMEELSKDFGDIATENKINVFAFCEGIRMEQVVCMCLMKWIFCNQLPVIILMLSGTDLISFGIMIGPGNFGGG